MASATSTPSTTRPSSASSSSASSSSSSPLPLTPTLLYHELVWKDDLHELKRVLEQQDQLRQKLMKQQASGSSTPASTSASSPAPPVLYDVNSQDLYGNTPLLLAVQLGRSSAVSLLLSHGAATKYRNAGGWSAVQEALSRGDRGLIRSVVTTWAERSEAEFTQRLPSIMRSIEGIADFYLEVDWKFTSWVPLLGRVLPSDRWRVWKKGGRLRVDTTLVDFSRSSLSWKRGSLSLLFAFSAEEERVGGVFSRERRVKGRVKVFAMDHIAKLFTKLSEDQEEVLRPGGGAAGMSAAAGRKATAEEEEEVEERIDDLMSSPLVSFTSPGKVEFTRAKAGFWGWRSDKTEEINGMACRVFEVKNINLLTEKRMEHLSEDERETMQQISRAIDQQQDEHEQHQQPQLEEAAEGDEEAADEAEEQQVAVVERQEDGDDGVEEVKRVMELISEPRAAHRRSLPPPPPPSISYEEYFAGNSAFPPMLLHNPSTQQHPFSPPPVLSPAASHRVLAQELLRLCLDDGRVPAVAADRDQHPRPHRPAPAARGEGQALHH